jgi:hypothetical protein
VSCLPILGGGLDPSREATGGYVEYQSASVMVVRPGEGGRMVEENGSGDAGRVLSLDEGREVGGDSRSRGGSLGDEARCRGELGREGVRELLE